MSAVTFSENHDESLISFEAGAPLVNTQDPHGEGLKWVYSLGAIPTSEVVVVGLGSGFHIAALAEVDPHIKIRVVETRESLLRVFRSQFPELKDRVEITIVQQAEDIFKTECFQEVLATRPYVLSFQECWGQQGKTFATLFAHLTGRSVESVRYHFEEFGINIKSTCNNLLSIHDLMPAIEESAMAENKKQVYRVLGELVR